MISSEIRKARRDQVSESGRQMRLQRGLDIPWCGARLGNTRDDTFQDRRRAVMMRLPCRLGSLFNMPGRLDPRVAIGDIAFFLDEGVFSRFKNTGRIMWNVFVQGGRSRQDKERVASMFGKNNAACDNKEKMTAFLAGRNEKGIAGNDHDANAAATCCCASSLSARMAAVSSSMPTPAKMSAYEMGVLEPSGSCHSGRLSCV